MLNPCFADADFSKLLLRLLIFCPHPRDVRRGSRHRISRRFLLHFLLPRNTSQPVEEESSSDVEDDECPHDPEISPPGRVRRTELGEVDVGAVNGAELAIGSGFVIDNIATCEFDVVIHVLATSLAGGWVEADVFDRRAFDALVGETGGEHTIDEIGEGGDTVHEDPEAGEGLGTRKDAV